MDPLSILMLVGFGITSSTSLYKIIDGLNSRKQEIRYLKAEVGDLKIVLQALVKNIEETSENFEILRLILEQCDVACKNFEKEVLSKVGESKSRVGEVKVWTRLQFLGGDIGKFQRLIGSYKATVTIALADANL